MRPALFLLSTLLVPGLSACTGEPGEFEGDAAGECTDDADNDQDGLFDCDDPDCAGAAACSEEADADTDADADADADTDTDTDTDTDPCTQNSVVEVFPANGVTNAYYRTRVDVTLDNPDPTATLALSTGSSAVGGSASQVEDRLSFVPDAPLAPATAYDVAVTYANGACSVDTRFTTSEVGGSLSDTSSLVGKAYDVDLASGRFVEPPGIGSLLGKYLGDVTFYLSPKRINATELTMIGALGNDAGTGQSVCDPTMDLPAADFTEDPYFDIDATGSTTNLTFQGVTTAIDDLRISGAFAPDGSYISGMVFAGSVDTRPLVDLVEEGGNPDAICELASAIGVQCEDCGGGEVFCLSVYVDNVSAVEATGVTITEQADPYDPCVDHAAECACVNGTYTPSPTCSIASAALVSLPTLFLVVPLTRRRREPGQPA
ncbi:MAG: hypothetical protein EP330_14125 [Deltaproteobacteria bacterium]|nr:MAG: hypothetical protein EP330_14125 [Deltaproteobacteria bacterium]